MAYLRELRMFCQYPGCRAGATKMLVDRWNGDLGSYCALHAKRALKDQEEREAPIPRDQP